MQPTLIGLILLPICLCSWHRPLWLLRIALIASVFDAAASMIIGGFGVPVAMVPGLMFLAYVIVQYMLGMRYPGERLVAWTLTPLFLLLGYGLVGAVLLPDFFEGQVLVWPQRVSALNIGRPEPLRPDGSGRNQCIYLALNVLITCIGALLLSRRSIPYRAILGTYLASGYLVVFLCVWQFASRIAGVPYPSDFLYSNPFYALLIDSIGSIPRINGPFTESAALATYLSGIVFSCMWLCVRGHDVLAPRLLFAISVGTTYLSTSTTGIITVTLGVPLVLLLVLKGGSQEGKRRIWSTIGLLVAGGLVLIGPLLLLLPSLLTAFDTVLQGTLSKSSSGSYAARTGADLDAITAFMETSGLGVGWGSFRSSSLLPGLLANGGAIGLGLIVWLVFRLRRLSQLGNGQATTSHPARIAVDGFSAAMCGQLGAALLSAPMVTSMSFFIQLACFIGAAIRIALDQAPPRRSAIANAYVPSRSDAI